MLEIFEHYLHTGSGWTKVTLTLHDDSGSIEFDSRWMGSGIKRYRFQCLHNSLSKQYGLLTVRSLEQYKSLDTDVTDELDICSIVRDDLHLIVEDEECDYYREITFEYIRLPQSEVWVADDRGLEAMNDFHGLATWAENFDLILIARYFPLLYDLNFTEMPLGLALFGLDKMKFVRISDDAIASNVGE